MKHTNMNDIQAEWRITIPSLVHVVEIYDDEDEEEELVTFVTQFMDKITYKLFGVHIR